MSDECREAFEFTIKGHKCLVDYEDCYFIKAYIWRLHGKRGIFYVTTFEPTTNRTIRLHRILLGLKHGDGVMVDHINGNSLDNRKCNLRICTNSQNQHNRGKSKRNTTGYKGVCLDKRRNKYYAQICINRHKINLGYFETPEQAHDAYVAAAKEYHKEFSNAG